MAKELNKIVIRSLKERFRDCQNCVVVDPSGIPGVMAAEMRRELRAEGGQLQVVKNSLAELALKDSPLAAVTPLLTGPTGLAAGEDLALIARRLLEWRKKNGVPRIRGGILSGRLMSVEEVERIAALPTREVLLGQVVGTIGGPLTGLVGTLQGTLQQFVGVFMALADKQEKQAS